MGEPSRAQVVRTYLERLGIDTRGRRRRPAVDVEIGEARIEPPPPSSEEAAALAPFGGPPSSAHADYRPGPLRGDELRRSPEHMAEIAAVQAEEERRARERQAARMRPETVRGNVAAGLPDAVPDAAVDAIAGTPLAALFDPDIGSAMEHGTRQGLTFGHEDELAGLVRAGRPSRSGVVIPDEEIIHPYRTQRDRVRAEQDAAQTAAPAVYGASEMAGSTLPGMLVPGAGPGSSLTQRVLTSAAMGTGLGGLSGAGHSRGDLGSSQFYGDVARDAALGGVAGAGSELTMAGLGALRDRLRGSVEGLPEPGGDFTPEQVAEAERRMDAGDPDVFDAMTQRNRMEDAAAQRRVRSTADSAALSDVRRAGDYHGPGGEGYRGLARDLDTYDVSPRGSLTRASTAQQRAARLENRAGRNLGELRARMEAAGWSPDIDTPIISNPDEAAALAVSGRAEEAARRATAREVDRGLPSAMSAETRASLDALDQGTPEWYANLDPETRATVDALQPEYGRSLTPQTPASQAGTGAARRRPRPQGVSLLDRGDDTIRDVVPRRPSPELDAVATETRAAIAESTDPARVRYGGEVTVLDDAGRAQTVPGGMTAQQLRARADEMMRRATTVEQETAAGQMQALADRMERAPSETYGEAQRRLSALDDEAAYGTRYPNAPGNTPERAMRAREARRGVRADMDAAVERTLGPDELARAREARGRYGVARSVGVLGERGAQREAANLQAGLGDTVAIHAGLNRNTDAGPATRVWNAIEGVLVNRYLRGMGHSGVAAIQEMQSDAMARAIVTRLNEAPVTQPMARALAEAQRRGPRAFGVALVTLGREHPEVQEAVAQEVSASPDWQAMGLPTADAPYDDTIDQPDWGRLGLPTADDEEETR